MVNQTILQKKRGFLMRDILDNITFRPKQSVIEITYSCNLKCKHCASDLNSNYVRGDQLTVDEFKTVINDIKKLGGEHLILSGGEALLHKEWDSIAQYAVGLGFKVSLISNGLIIDSNVAKKIKNAGISLVALSIDGNEEIHNFMRNNNRSYSKVLEAARLLKNENIKVNFITTVTKANIDILDQIENTIYQLGVDYWLIQIGSPMGRLNRHHDLVIDPTDLPIVVEYIISAKKRGLVKISIGDNIGYYSDNEMDLRKSSKTGNTEYFCGCFAGCLVVGIESNGNVKGCLSLQDDRFIEGNVRNESLIDIWNKKANFSYTRNFKKENLEGNCKKCDYGEICRGGCSFLAFGSTGRLYSNPYCMQSLIIGEKN